MHIKRIPSQGSESIEATLEEIHANSDKEWEECAAMLLHVMRRLRSHGLDIEIWAGFSRCHIFFTYDLLKDGIGGISAWNGTYTITKAHFSHSDIVSVTETTTTSPVEATELLLSIF